MRLTFDFNNLENNRVIAKLFPVDNSAAGDIYGINNQGSIVFNEDLFGLKVIKFDIQGCSVIENEVSQYNLIFGGDIHIVIPIGSEHTRLVNNDRSYYWVFRVSYSSIYSVTGRLYARNFRIQRVYRDNYRNVLPNALGNRQSKINFAKYILLIISAIYNSCLNVAKEGILANIRKDLNAEFLTPIYTTFNQQVIQSSFRTMAANEQNDNANYPNTTKGLELSLSQMSLPMGNLPIHDVELDGAFRISFK